MANAPLIICGTGHRPEHIGQPEYEVKAAIRQALTSTNVPVDHVVSGGAAGFDLWLAEVACELGITVTIARPWKGHIFRKADIQRWAKVLRHVGTQEVAVNPSLQYPGPFCYYDRNRWMVDNSTAVLAYWDITKQSGGTFNCVTYAGRAGKPIRNIHPSVQPSASEIQKEGEGS